MSVMSSLILEIQEMLMEGIPTLAVATALNVPVDWVYEIKEVIESAD
tara:strand:- start:280 stop:420 length:141 start_codon:yes stop_codon:yes gene_type:complete